MTAACMDPAMNECYLLHLKTPLGHARHYLGVTTNLAKRLKLHATGRGANMLRVAKERQGKAFGFTLARTWDIPVDMTPRAYEIKLKNRGSGARSCPICQEAARAAKKSGRN